MQSGSLTTFSLIHMGLRGGGRVGKQVLVYVNIFDEQELSSSFFFCLQVVNRSICLSQFPTAIPNNYFPSEFAEMLASHLFLFHPTTAPNKKKTNIILKEVSGDYLRVSLT